MLAAVNGHYIVIDMHYCFSDTIRSKYLTDIHDVKPDSQFVFRFSYPRQTMTLHKCRDVKNTCENYCQYQ